MDSGFLSFWLEYLLYPFTIAYGSGPKKQYKNKVFLNRIYLCYYTIDYLSIRSG